MKLVFVAYFHGTGGAEKQITMLANSMSEKGHEVHMIILAESINKFNLLDSVVIHDLTECEFKSGNKLINRFKAFKKELKSIRPDITINFWFQSAYFCSLLKKSITGKIIYSERGDPSDNEYNGILGVIRRLAFIRIDGFVFQTEGARDYFNMSIKNRSTIIHNPVVIQEKKFMHPCSTRDKNIITVGRLHKQKNQKLLIQAFSNIADKIPEYRLDIYGDGELEEDLTNLIRNYKLENRIFLKGTVNNIMDYIYKSSLFVLTSNYEGLPNALMEAISLGVPSISTDCSPGGARSLLDQYNYGFLIPRNDVDVLSKKILEVLNKDIDPKILNQDSSNFRNSHSPKITFDKWENFIYKIKL